jgi:S1-C subfamily serine protease
LTASAAPPAPPSAYPPPTAYAAPVYAPAPKKSNTCLYIGCGAAIMLALVLMCVVGVFGITLFGGDTTPTPVAVPTQPIVLPVSTGTTVAPVKVEATATATVTPTPPRTGLSPILRTALMGSVLIVSLNEAGVPIASGSGTVLTPQGHILTNFHVIGNTDTGVYDNRRGLVWIGISPPELNAKPDIRFMAQVIKGDKDLDLAVVRIVATKDGGKLPADLGLTVVPVGDSDSVQIGDEISVIGFPTLGDGTVTFTRGSVSGFLADTASIGTWMKTDTEINPGNSGGTAINSKGELIGVPTEARFDTKFIGKIGKIRPVNFAKPFVQFAQRDAAQAVTFSFTPWSSTASKAPTPKPGAASFGAIVICEDTANGQPVNPRTTFPAGTTQVTAYWTFKGMTNGQAWGRRWLRDGQVEVDRMNLAWEDDEEGSSSYFLSDESGLSDGNYEIQIYIGNTLAQKATFTIQKAASGPTPTTAPVTGSFGKIVFAEDVTDSGETVNPGAAFPAGITEVWAYFTYVNMKPGQSWGRKWLRDGTVLVDKTESWDKGATGWRAFSYGGADGMTSGTYEFVLYLSGKEVQRAKFTVGSTAKATSTPTKPPAAARPALDATLSNPHYERWGKPTNADGCNDPTNATPVRRFTMQLIITNRTSQTVSGDWGPRFYSNTGATLARCYYDYAGAGTITPGQTRNVTFVSYTNTDGGDWVSQVVFSALGGTWTWTLDREARILSGP